MSINSIEKPEKTPLLAIQQFGTFAAYVNGKPLSKEDWKTEQNKRVLKILCSQPGQYRESVMLYDIFWPDKDEKKADGNLRARISDLRRILEPNREPRAESKYIKKWERGYYFCADDCQIDTEEFRDLCQRSKVAFAKGDSDGALEAASAAASLYLGDYLPHDNFEEWAMPIRKEMRELHLELMLSYVELAFELQGPALAKHVVQDALRFHPFEEKFYRSGIRCHQDLQEYQQAFRIYQRVRRDFESQGLPLSEAITALHAETLSAIPLQSGTKTALQKKSELETQIKVAKHPKVMFDLLMELNEQLGKLGEGASQTEILDKALECAHNLNSKRRLAHALNKQAKHFFQLGEFQLSWKSASAALSYASDNKDQVGRARSLHILATLHLEKSKYQEATRLFDSALAQMKAISTVESKALRRDVLYNIGLIHSKRQEFHSSLDYIEQALRLNEELDDFEVEANLLLGLGSLYNRWGKFAMARHYWEHARDLAQIMGNLYTEVHCLNNLAILSRREGNLQAALEQYTHVLETKEKLNDQRGLSKLWHNFSNIYTELGLYREALAASDKCLALSRQLDYKAGEAAALVNRSAIKLQLNEWDELVVDLDHALKQAEAAEDREWQAEVWLQLGHVFRKQSEYFQAEEYIQRALDLSLQINKRELIVSIRSALMNCYLESRNLDPAFNVSSELIEDLESCPPGIQLMEAHYILARFFDMMKNVSDSQHHTHAAHDLYVQRLERIEDSKLRTSFARTALNKKIMSLFSSICG